MIAVYAPGSVSNVACGFDVMGFALDEPGDVVVAAPQDASGVSIAAIHGDDGRLTTDPRKNTASAAVLALLQRLETTRGVSLTIHKGLPLASGIGSSGASAVAAVVAANELLGRPAPMPMLLECAMAGEQAGCGAIHPGQRHTVVIWRLHPRAERAAAGHRPPAGARRAWRARCCIRRSKSRPAPRES